VTAFSSGSRRRILVVDDNIDAAVTLADVLRFFGHEVATAFSAADGERLAGTLEPEVILCDLGMPRMDGYELASRLRRDPRLCRIRLIAVSGHEDADAVAAAVEAGFDAHIPKPPDIQRLVGLLRPDTPATPERAATPAPHDDPRQNG
jgi:CheY-like chemotaxis protein